MLINKIQEAKAMCLKDYGVKVKITIDDEGFQLGIDEPIYYKEQARMVKKIRDIIGWHYTQKETYVL